MENEIIIHLVKERPALWDSKDKKHSQRDYIKKLWDEIADESGLTSDAAKNKWRSLRENFRKELGKQKTTTGQAGNGNWQSRWVHFHEMLFLLEQYTPRGMTGNMGPSSVQEILHDNNDNVTLVITTDENEVEVSDKMSDFPRTSAKRAVSESGTYEQVTRQKKFKKSLLEKMVSIEERKVAEYERKRESAKLVQDADYYFLMSLLPSLRAVPPNRKMAVRRRMEDVFIDEDQMNTQYSDTSSTNTSFQNVEILEGNSGQFLMSFDSVAPTEIA